MRRCKRLLIVFMLGMLLVACGAVADTEPTIPAPTAETITDTSDTEEISADTSEARGQILFTRSYNEVGFACASCHYITESRLIGPGMANIAVRVEDYESEQSLEDYIRQSILNPQEFIPEETPSYPQNVMPQTYSDIFSDDEIDDLVAYILSL